MINQQYLFVAVIIIFAIAAGVLAIAAWNLLMEGIRFRDGGEIVIAIILLCLVGLIVVFGLSVLPLPWPTETQA
jgi:uncharacterized membrane protein YidH (DUF202 family)